MKGETEERKPKKRKKKNKFGYYLYAVVILILTIVNITFAAWLLTYVQNIYVKGNKHSSQSEIVDWVKKDAMTVNSLYTLWKFKTGSYQLPIYLEDVDVRLTAPWTVEVTVKEKEILGCVPEGTAFIYFDKEGLVLQKTTQYNETIPLIEGIEAEKTGQFSYMEVKEKKLFSYLVSLLAEIENQELSPDRIVWEADGFSLYFAQVKVSLGKTNFSEKVAQLPLVLGNLEGEDGTLHLEHYSSENKRFSFEKNDEKNY